MKSEIEKLSKEANAKETPPKIKATLHRAIAELTDQLAEMHGRMADIHRRLASSYDDQAVKEQKERDELLRTKLAEAEGEKVTAQARLGGENQIFTDKAVYEREKGPQAAPG